MKTISRTFATALLITATAAGAQSYCSSDGRKPPVRLVERFISADCEHCWSAPEAAQTVNDPQALVLDWIVPGSLGDEAPLAPAATRDSVHRLSELHLSEVTTWKRIARSAPDTPTHQLRVAHGLPLVNYVGASMELTPASGGPWAATLLLVEHIPAGVDGTPIARNLVRNKLVTRWQQDPNSSTQATARFFESRPMSLPEGTQVQRLVSVAWVENASGQLEVMAQSACQPPQEEQHANR